MNGATKAKINAFANEITELEIKKQILAVKRIKPLMNCNFGLSVHTRFFRKKKTL